MACGVFPGPARRTHRRFPKDAPDYRGEAARREIKRDQLRRRDRARVSVGRGLHGWLVALGGAPVPVPRGIADQDQVGQADCFAERYGHGHGHGATQSASASASETPTPTHSPTPTPTPTHTHSPTPTPSPSATTFFPTAAPQTGGGGTAGFQDTLLVALGGAAILAGAGSIAYRRRVLRNR